MLNRRGEMVDSEEKFKTCRMGFGNISGKVSWAPTMDSILDSMPWKRLEETPEYEVQAMGHMLCNLSY